MSVRRSSGRNTPRALARALGNAGNAIGNAVSRAVGQTVAQTWRDLCAAPSAGRARVEVEPLERRQLLTTLTGGGVSNGVPLERIFEYKDANNDLVRISLKGNITAEFIGLWVDPDTNATRLVNLIPATVPDSVSDGADLFHIYVARSDANASISIATVPALTAEDRPMDPFSSPRDIRVFDATRGRLISFGPAQDTGGVYIGAQTKDIFPDTTDEQDIPITRQNFNNSFGVRPRLGPVLAGIQVAPGQKMARMFIGGTVTGVVNFGGPIGSSYDDRSTSIDIFYAGNVFTGETIGIGGTSSPGFGLEDNFYVSGDLRQLVVRGGIGGSTVLNNGLDSTEIEYKTGFDLQVDGRLGQVLTKDSFVGSAEVVNSSTSGGPGVPQTELEIRDEETEGDVSFFQGNNPAGFFEPLLGLPALGDENPADLFFNDTFETAQILGTAFDAGLADRNVINVRGSIRAFENVNDNVDYYGVALLAGQTVTVQLAQTSGLLNVGVFDPDNRLIATDYNNKTLSATQGQPFRFTADRPGVYRFAVANTGNIEFNAAGSGPVSIGYVVGQDPYELRIHNTGDIALGGIVAAGSIGLFNSLSESVRVARGDLGTLMAGVLDPSGDADGDEDGAILSASAPITVLKGNLRSMVADSIGATNGTVVGLAPDLIVPVGSVGLLRIDADSLRDSDVLALNDDFVAGNGSFDASVAIRGDYQLIDTFGPTAGFTIGAPFAAHLLTNRAIGTIRADSVALPGFAPRLAVNANDSGDDGVIDLIDVIGDFGTISSGGPQITTGENGNVRYIRVGGQLFRDIFFGGGLPEEITYAPGQVANLTDDSGTKFTITPDSTGGTANLTTGASLVLLTYPIRDKGGVVVVNLTVNPGATAGVDNDLDGVPDEGTAGIVNPGVRIDSGAAGRFGSVEISELFVNTEGALSAFDPITDTFTFDPGADPVDVVFRGKSRIDTFSIVAQTTGGAGTSSLRNIINRTSGGEVVNVLANGVYLIEADMIGFARSSTNAEVSGATIQNSSFPFNQQRNLIHILANRDSFTLPGTQPDQPGTTFSTTSNLVEARGRRLVGNILVENGNVGTLRADYEGNNDNRTFEGINAPIYATNTTANSDEGNLVFIDIGEGILPSGSGNLSHAGLYADNTIGRVVNNGIGSDIRGDIVASGRSRLTTEAIIQSIELNNGAIINAEILTVSDLSESMEFPFGLSIPIGADPFGQPTFEIGSIELDGLGGIIGTIIAAEDIGPISIEKGFGLINSDVSSLGDSHIEGVETDGYGVRSVSFDGGATMGGIVARGNGKQLDTRNWTYSVRQSESYKLDPYFGSVVSPLTDLHQFLGTNKFDGTRDGWSESGGLEDTVMIGSRDLGDIDVFRIVGRNTAGLAFSDPSYPMRIAFANSIGTIRVRDKIDGLSVVTGSLETFNPFNDVRNTFINVAGEIKEIKAGRSLLSSVGIKATGPDGSIGSISTGRELNASITASVDIGKVFVGTDLGSPKLQAGDDMKSLTVRGNVVPGAFVRVFDDLETLSIDGDIKDGATVRAGSIEEQRIGGQVIGDLIVG